MRPEARTFQTKNWPELAKELGDMEGRPKGWRTGGEASFQLVLTWPQSWPVVNPRAQIGKARMHPVFPESARSSPQGPRMGICALSRQPTGPRPGSALSPGLGAAAAFHKITFSSLKAAFANRALLNREDI